MVKKVFMILIILMFLPLTAYAWPDNPVDRWNPPEQHSQGQTQGQWMVEEYRRVEQERQRQDMRRRVNQMEFDNWLNSHGKKDRY